MGAYDCPGDHVRPRDLRRPPAATEVSYEFAPSVVARGFSELALTFVDDDGTTTVRRIDANGADVLEAVV